MASLEEEGVDYREGRRERAHRAHDVAEAFAMTLRMEHRAFLALALGIAGIIGFKLIEWGYSIGKAWGLLG